MSLAPPSPLQPLTPLSLEEKAEDQLAKLEQDKGTHTPPHPASAALEQHIDFSPFFCHLFFKGHPADFVPSHLSFQERDTEFSSFFPVGSLEIAEENGDQPIYMTLSQINKWQSGTFEAGLDNKIKTIVVWQL